MWTKRSLTSRTISITSINISQEAQEQKKTFTYLKPSQIGNTTTATILAQLSFTHMRYILLLLTYVALLQSKTSLLQVFFQLLLTHTTLMVDGASWLTSSANLFINTPNRGASELTSEPTKPTPTSEPISHSDSTHTVSLDLYVFYTTLSYLFDRATKSLHGNSWMPFTALVYAS